MKEYTSAISTFARISDMAAIYVAGLLSYYWKFGTFSLHRYYQFAILLGVMLSMIIFPMWNIYRSWRGRNQFSHVKLIILAWGMVLLILVLIASMMKVTQTYSREWTIAWSLSGLVVLLLFRFLVTVLLKYFRTTGWNTRKVLIAGANNMSRNLLSKANKASWAGIDIYGFVDGIVPVGEIIEGVEVKGGFQDADRLVKEEGIDEVWVVLPITHKSSVLEILDSLRYSTVDVRYFLDMEDFRLMNHSITEIMGMPVVNLTESPMHGINRGIKALEDRLLAFVILVLVSPLLLVIAIAIKTTSSGPVLFKQYRHGWDGRRIKVYKFRTMYEHEEVNGEVRQASKDDQRVTPVGSVLRRTSLDELPQFFNVLQGRMSIVGPRPHAIAHNEQYKGQIEAYMLRHKVKPGITGWAQVNGWRGETDTLEKMQKRVEYDIYYIEHWSLWFDIQIMLMTLFKGFTHENAY